MPALTNVIRGSRTITSADSATINVTVSSVDTTRSIVMFTCRPTTAGDADKTERYEGILTSATNLQFNRQTNAFAGTDVIEYSIVEFASGALTSLQSGVVDCTASPTDVTISAVSTSKVFPILSYKRNAGNVGNNRPVPTFSSTTNLRLTFQSAPSTGEYVTRWQVVEFATADVTIQSGTLTPSSGNSAVEVTTAITSVNTAKTLLAAFSRGGEQWISRHSCRVHLKTATSVAAQMQNVSGEPTVAGTVQFYAMEFLDGTRVEAGTGTIAAASSAPASAPSWASAMTNGAVFNCAPETHMTVYVTSATDLGDHNSLKMTLALDSPQSSITVNRPQTAPALAYFWQAVEWGASSGNATVPVTGNSATGAVGTTTRTITTNPAVTGNAATGATGTTTPKIDKGVTGNAGTGAVGTVAVRLDDSISVSGNAATGSTGTTVPNVLKAVTGNQATGAVGNVTVSAGGSITVSPTGNAAIGSVGTVAVTLTSVAALTGLSATGQVGSVSVSVPSTATTTGGGWLSPEQVKHLERLARESTRARQKDWERAREEKAARLAELERIYDRVNGLVNDEESAELAAVVAPFAQEADEQAPAAAAIDWQALYAQAKAVAQLTQALQRIIAEQQRKIAARQEQDDLETLAFLANLA